MKASRGLIALALAAFSLFASSCRYGSFEPYLVLDVKEEYDPGTVEIGYSFLSEREEQRCRILLSRTGLEEYSYISGDSKIPNAGVLTFSDLDAGSYTLYFAVLSERGHEPLVIPFLEQYHYFLVR
ncbi:MAG: hypothetical protein JW760_00165 [Spirochaetales bacterium]|nr:hypothetical protein [Spirochaetales bacterium]